MTPFAIITGPVSALLFTMNWPEVWWSCFCFALCLLIWFCWHYFIICNWALRELLFLIFKTRSSPISVSFILVESINIWEFREIQYILYTYPSIMYLSFVFQLIRAAKIYISNVLYEPFQLPTTHLENILSNWSRPGKLSSCWLWCLYNYTHFKQVSPREHFD